MIAAHPPYALFPILECGVDYLTCTAPRGAKGNRLREFAEVQLDKENAGGGASSPAIRLGFLGHRTKHAFVGLSSSHVMFQVSGPGCSPLAREAISLASNVSRIDLQVTVWTEGEQAHLAAWTYRRLCDRGAPARHNSRLTMIQGQPDGETLYLGRRVSEYFGRLYDKTVESRLGPPRLVWRYELELKGKASLQQARLLEECGVHPSTVSTPLHAWYTKKGVRPAFSPPRDEYAFQPFITSPSQDVLSWFRNSLSKTYARAVVEFGREEVHAALGIKNESAGG